MLAVSNTPQRVSVETWQNAIRNPYTLYSTTHPDNEMCGLRYHFVLRYGVDIVGSEERKKLFFT